MRIVAASCLVLAVLIATLPASAMAEDQIKTDEAACAALKKQAKLIGDPDDGPADKWGCEPVYEQGPYLVVGLHAVCSDPDGCGSTLIGWFGVRKSDGKVYYWDEGEDTVGKPLTSEQSH